MDILHEIAQRTIERIEAQKRKLPLEQIVKNKMICFDETESYPFEEALRTNDISFICEVKKASPSKGVIAEDFPYLDIARDYESAGASAISVLTEPFWFMGADQYLREISESMKIPLLRKDFTVDSYMIYEAKMLGASAVLLICSLLDRKTLREYLTLAHSIGLSALVEVHNEEEVDMALCSGARVIGVNNRNLRTFEVDITLSERLRKMIPREVIFVSESGISTPDDIKKLREIKADAALIGERIMRSFDKTAEINRLRGESKYGEG